MILMYIPVVTKSFGLRGPASVSIGEDVVSTKNSGNPDSSCPRSIVRLAQRLGANLGPIVHDGDGGFGRHRRHGSGG
jgi:hypothetical protein